MNIFLRILLGLGIVAVGSFIVIKTKMIMDFFGRSDWAERKLGGGGTNLLYKAIGMAVCFIGIIVATNLWDAFIEATLGSILTR